MDNVITPSEMAQKMRELITGDKEAQHGDADCLMCQVLNQLGYGEAVAIYEAMEKWYA